MQVSKRKINATLEKQLFAMLWQLISDIKDPKEAEAILSDLLSETELVTVAKRLAVGYWLTNRRSYENIKNNLNVSSATVADVQQRLKKEGWKMAIEKMRAEEWATKWEERIKKMLGKK